MEAAPFRSDLADAPEGGRIVWRHAPDGVRLRLGWWRPEPAKGTVFLLPGRTEYLEKYGKTIGRLTGEGWAVISVDWRGQGLSDRLWQDGRLGHVQSFTDYQLDVEAMLGLAEEAGLPEPRVMIAHSMGGCIGLRALCTGFPVARAVFSAPMWGIEMPAVAKPLTYIIPPIARMLKAETAYAPGTRPVNYVSETGFLENMLTGDRETFDWLGRHAASAPEFALGGPSVQWVGSATREIRRLFTLPRPEVPTLTFVGTLEQIVATEMIRRFHASWPAGELREIEGAKHELMMEVPALRQRFFDETFGFLDGGS